MRSNRYLAGALVGAASIAVTSLLAIPASADVASCSDARASRDAAANVEQGTRGRLSNANSALNVARSALGTAVAADNTEDATSPDTALDAADQQVTLAQFAVNARVGDVNTAQSAENTALANLTAAETAVNTACNTPVSTTTPAPVGLPGPTTPPTIVYRYVGGKYCKCTNGSCVAVTPPSTVVTQPPSTVYVPPPVTAPSPVIIYPPAPSTGTFSQIPSGSVPSGSVSTGDGSVQVDSDILTVTVLAPVHLIRS